MNISTQIPSYNQSFQKILLEKWVDLAKKIFKLSLAVFLGITCFTQLASPVHAATRTWDGGGGADTNWSTCANWSTDTCPVQADTVVFSGTSDNNSTVDAAWITTRNGGNDDVAIISIISGYDGTITLAASLQTTSTFTQSSGTFNASNQALDIDSVFTLNAGATFRASSGTMTMAGSFTINGGTWDVTTNAGGTVTFDGASGTLSCNGISFSTVRITHASGVKTVSNNCSLPLGASPTIGTGTGGTTLLGTLSGTGTLTTTSGTFTLSSGATLSGFNTLTSAAITVNGGTINISAYSAFSASSLVNISSGSLSLPSGADLNAGLTISGGSFTAPSGSMTLAGSLTISNSPTFNANGGTITFDGTSNTMTCGSITLNNIIVSTNAITNVKTQSGNCTVNAFTLTNGVWGNPSSAATLFVNGSFAQNANSTFGGANLTVELKGSSTQNLSKTTGTFSSKLNINRSSGQVDLTTAFATTGQTCNLVEGTFDLNDQAFTCGSTFTVEDGGNLQLQGGAAATTPTLNSGSTVTYDGTTGPYTLKDWGYHHLVVNGSGGTFSTASSADVNGNFTLSAGTFTAPSGNFTIAGNFIHSGGTFTHNSGTVILDGTGQSLTGSTTFYSFTKTVSSTQTLTFPGSETQTFAGTMTFQGAADNLLSLRSSTSSQWKIDPQGSRSVSYLDVKDSNNINATYISVAGAHITDSGNNTGWGFDLISPVLTLDSPSEREFTSNERPAFRWHATDNFTGVRDYDLTIDNPSIGDSEPSGDFTISDIPFSGTTNYETNKYVVQYENFSDSDSTNNYISVHTKSSSDWSRDENDGKVREGVVRWRVRAADELGNSTESSRSFLVDRSGPHVEFTQLDSTPINGAVLSTTQANPTLFGKITDSLAGPNLLSGQTQDESGPKVASGPHQVQITLAQKQGFTTNVHTIYTLNFDQAWYTCDNSLVTDNSKNQCDKYTAFSFSPQQPLESGTYIATIVGVDNMGNSGGSASFTFNVGAQPITTTPSQTTFIPKPTPQPSPSVEQEFEASEPEEAMPTSEGASVQQQIAPLISFVQQFLSSSGQWLLTNLNSARDSVVSTLAYVGGQIGKATTYFAQQVGNGFLAIGNMYNTLSKNNPGIPFLAKIGDEVGNAVSASVSGISTLAQRAGNSAKGAVSSTAFIIGEKTQDVSDTAGLAIVKVGYMFLDEPTTISSVRVEILSPTSAKISWETNHPANSKVNYGLDETYPFDVQSEKRVTHHEFVLTDLQPNTQYHFEVMSHNNNYVYDANRKFTTPGE